MNLIKVIIVAPSQLNIVRNKTHTHKMQLSLHPFPKVGQFFDCTIKYILFILTKIFRFVEVLLQSQFFD